MIIFRSRLVLWYIALVPIAIIKFDSEDFILLVESQFKRLLAQNKTSHFSFSLLSGFFKIVSRSTSAPSMSIRLSKYLAFQKSGILYNNCVFVSLNSWPKFVLSSISFEIHENALYGMSTVNSPWIGLASFGLELR